MSVRILNKVPPKRRDRLFAKIRRMVNECDAVDRALEAVGEEGAAIDETLECVVGLIRREARRVKKSRFLAAA